MAESYDGDILRFRVSEEELLSKYPEGAEVSESTTEQTKTTKNAGPTEETTIPLTGEKLDVSKNVHEEEATITKEPVTETKTIEVSVTHEEVSIERRSPTGGDGQVASEGPATSAEEISIPLMREEVEVSKTPYVKEEVAVKKKPVTETEEVTSERIDIKD